MKKDFQKFQNAFYKAVAENLPVLDALSTYLHITPVAGVFEDEGPFLDVTFSYREVTGRENTESILIEATDDAAVAVERFRDELKKKYPGFVLFKSLEEAIETAIEVDDEDLCFNYVSGENDTPSLTISISHKEWGVPDAFQESSHQRVYIVQNDEDQMTLDFNPAETTIEEMVKEVKQEFYGEWD